MKNNVVLSRELTVLKGAFGAVILEALADPQVVEVMVNADGRVWIDRIGEGRIDTGETLTYSMRDTILKMVANHIGETITKDSPQLSAVLPETGERFQGLCPPVVSAPCFTIRKRPEIIFTLENYVEQGSLTKEKADLLREAVANRKNILVAGGTGSGKTTFVNALLALPDFTQERIVIIEDTPELQCSAVDKVELLTKRTEPPLTMRDLVMTTLRLRPDRIIVGEVRDGSALDMLKAWNTGHPGGIATIHANSAQDALGRLEDLVGEVSAQISYRAIASAIDLVVFMCRTQAGREVREIVAVKGYEGNKYVFENVYPRDTVIGREA